LGCCCSVFGLAASSARLAIHASYSGVPRRGGVSAGRPPIACGIRSPTCMLLQDGSDRTARQRNTDLIAFATRLISDLCRRIVAPGARPDRSGDTFRPSNPAHRAMPENRPRSGSLGIQPRQRCRIPVCSNAREVRDRLFVDDRRLGLPRAAYACGAVTASPQWRPFCWTRAPVTQAGFSLCALCELLS